MADPARQLNDPEHTPGNQDSEPASRPDWYHSDHPKGAGETTPRSKDHLKVTDNESENLANDEANAGQDSPQSPHLSLVPESLGQHENQVGSGYTPRGTRGHKARGLRSVMLNRRGAAGGGIIATIIAIVFGFSIISGPLQLIHYSQLLSKNFANHDQASGLRLGSLYRWARTGEVGQTRVGFLGSKVIEGMDKKLARQGISIDRSGRFGLVRSIRIDIERHPYYKLLPASEVAAEFAKRNGIPIEKVTKASGLGGTSGRGSVYVGEMSQLDTSVRRTAVLGGDVGDAIRQESLHKIVGSVQLRTAITSFLNLPSGLHPIKKFIIDKFKSPSENKKVVDDRDRDRKARVVSTSAKAREKAAALRKSLGVGAGTVSGALLVAGGMCLAKDVAKKIPEINRDNIALPSMQSAADAIALGAQIQSGQDIDLAQVGAVVEGLKDKDGKTVWDARAVKSLAGQEGGEDVDPDIKQAFSPHSSAAEFEKTLDENFGADAICSDFGKFTQLVVGGLLLFVPGPGWAIKAAGVAAGATAIAIVTETLPKLLADEPLVATAHEGPKGGNIDAYGARELANTAYRASGGTELSQSQSSALQLQSEAEQAREFSSKNFASRLFDVKDYRSLASRFIDGRSNNPAQNLGNFANSILDFRGLGSNLASLFLPRVFAAEKVSYDYGFPQYGFSQESLEDPLFEDPYANADEVAKLLDDKSTRPGLIDRAKTCFGVAVSQGPNGWDAVAGADITPSSAEYLKASCNSTDKSWLRLRFFIFDTRVSASYVCYEGDAEACSQLGLSNADSSSSAVTPGASDPNFVIQKLKTPLPTSDGQITPKGITLHWWSNQPGRGIQALVDIFKGNGFSVQVGITKDGEVYQMTENLTDRTSHAIGGNDTTIGIEIEGGPAEFGKVGIEKYPEKFEAVVATIKFLVNKYSIPLEGKVECGNVVGVHPHSAYNHCPNAVSKEDIDEYYFNEVMKRVRE